jgi:DHA1 family tetracycline resistance protein-like MFS transporter
VLPESLPPEHRAPMRWSKANPWGAVDLLLQRPGLLVLGLAQLLIWLAFQGTSNMMVLYTAFRYGWSPLTFGVFATALAAANIVVQGGVAGRLARAVGERRAALVGLGLQAATFVAVGLAPNGALFWAAKLASVLGAVAGPALQTMMTAKVSAHEQGRLQGATGSIASLTGIVAPVAFTQLFAWSVTGDRGPGWSGLTILIGAALSLAAFGLVVGVGRESSRPAT